MSISAELNQLVATVRRDLSVLFGFQTVAFFLYQAQTHLLEGVSGDQDEESLWSTITVNVDSQESLLSKACRNRRVLHSFNVDKNDPATLVDRQICQLLHCEDMIAIPVVFQEQTVAVIAASLKRSEVKRVKDNMDFIHLYLGEAAKILHNSVAVEPVIVHSTSESNANFALYARKLGHEINNPLSIINNYLYLLGLKLDKDQKEEVKVIQEEIDRVAQITLSLSDFSMDTVNVKDSVDLNKMINDLLTLFKAGLFRTHNIASKLKLDDGLLTISSNKDKIKQILTNVIKNAVEALPGGGEICISTKASVPLRNKSFVLIQVQDNGPGISEEIKKHLFTPVTSTKGKHYSGLGLTICKNLVDELKGEIRCDSSADTGTLVQIYLPKEI